MAPSLILLSLGTHQQPFPRALDLIQPIAEGGDEVIIQHGSTPPRMAMANVSWREYMDFDELVATMRKADNVVCHAGVGTIMTALQNGHSPIVIPRLARHGEHVDDHQLDITGRFAERGLVRCVKDGEGLAAFLAQRAEDQSHAIGAGSEELRRRVLEATG
jgi:UDP-N-acetylglucosamine transferase subunit ALG13